MTNNVDSDLIDVNESLISLDSWIDAFKDVSIVSAGILASYISLASGGTIDVSLILIILAVSILSSIFLPYKVAITRRSILGVFSRYRAIELMIVIFVSWSVPTLVVLLFPEIWSYLPPQSESRFVWNLLTIALPNASFIVIILFAAYGLRNMFSRIGITDMFFEKYGKYPWGFGFLSLWIVSLTVTNVQLLLLEAAQTYVTSTEEAIPIYARAFGGLIVLILLCCSLTYFEPKRILTFIGGMIFGLVGLGVIVTLFHPLVGFLISVTGIIVLIWYSSSLPPPDIESIIAEKKRLKDNEDISANLYRKKYGWRALVADHLNNVLFVVAVGLTFAILLFEIPDYYPISTHILFIVYMGWFIVYGTKITIKHRLYMQFMDFIIDRLNEGEELTEQIVLDAFIKVVRPKAHPRKETPDLNSR